MPPVSPASPVSTSIPRALGLARSGLVALTLALAPGCAGQGRGEAAAPEAAPAVSPEEHAFFTAQGEAGSLDAFLAAIEGVDLVAFGELHYHPVGSRVELAVLEGMAAQGRPVALAMEFFERDTQAAVDDYLAGVIDRAALVERTQRDARYDASHGPLIDLCKAKGIPVIAANAPRPLVTAYRKSGIDAYADWLATRSEDERALLPRSSEIRDDAFTRRFLEFMGPKRGPAFLKSMVLWNDAMAEAAADFRAAHPEHRVLLVVGGFHVAGKLGLITSYLERRPDDRAAILLMDQVDEGPLAFTADDAGEADLLLKVRPAAE
ncbi:MAG: ChaN family lipoprotein [Nannocystaceae bacterium]